MNGAMITSPHIEPESICSNKRISPRNSKWIQENITDLETKVKEVVTLIQEDASSFHRKAEMYFRKRPMLMKLIEELYRAYRALAERYDYTNGELEWAQRAMKKAIPSEVLFGLLEDSPSSSSTNLCIEPKDVVTKESEIFSLKNALVTRRGEKEDILLKYKKTMKKLSDLEEELNYAKMGSKGFREQAIEAKTEVQKLKEAITRVEVDRDAAFLHQKELFKRISTLERRIIQVQEEGINDGAPRADIRSKCLEKEVSRLEADKETSFFCYNTCLDKIADLERNISLAENKAKLVHERAYRAEAEEKKLRNDLDRLNKEKTLVAIEYDNCLDKVSNLETELSCTEDEIRRISNKVFIETEKINSADDRYTMLEFSNSNLKSDVIILESSIAMKEKDLANTQEELEKLVARVHEDKLGFVKVEAATLALQNFQSQEDNRSLEIREVVQVLKEFNISHDGMENENVNSQEDFKSILLKLKGIKEKLEEEVEVQKETAKMLQNHVNVLKEDIEDLKERYQALKEKIKWAGLNPECVGSAIKAIKDDNSKLRQIYKESKKGKETLLDTLDSLEQISKENTGIDMSCEWLDEDKLAIESQVRTFIDYVEKLTEKNTVLENPLFVADVELESPQTKSQNSEELFDERRKLVIALDSVANRLKSLENRFSEAERKCTIMEKEQEPTLAQLEDVKVSLGLEKRERSSSEMSSEARLDSLEKHLHFLNQEIKWSTIEFEEEVSRAVYAHFEIFILHITIQNLEMKNRSLSSECEKHVETSKLRENLVLELERENLEQQVEIELLISEIEKLRADIFQVFKALGFATSNKLDDIIENIEGMKSTLLSYEEDRRKLLVENSILLELLGQAKVEGNEILKDKSIINKEFENVKEQLMIVQNDTHELVEMNIQLKSEIKNREHIEEKLRAEIERFCVQQKDMDRDYVILKEEHCLTVEEKSSTMKNIVHLRNQKQVLEEENEVFLAEIMVLDNKCTVFKNLVTEKDMEIDSFSKDLQNLKMVNISLEKEVGLLKNKMEMEEKEKLTLQNSVKEMEKEIQKVHDLNNHLRVGISEDMKIICQKEMEVCLAEEQIKATENLNFELHKTLDEITKKLEEMEIMKGYVEKENINLSEENQNQGEEILFLREVNGSLSLEIDENQNEFQNLRDQFGKELSMETVMLCDKDIEFSLSEEELKSKHDEIAELTEQNENQRIEIQVFRETNRNLNAELEEMKKECRLWESEASTYHFDLQVSKAYEIILENKVRELSSVCETLGKNSLSKSVEVEKMKENVESMESDIGLFKAQLSSYGPVIHMMQENMTLLEHKILGQPGIEVDNNSKSKDLTELENQAEEHISAIPNRLQELHDLQTRIKALEKVVTGNKRRVITEDLELSAEQDDKAKEEINLDTELVDMLKNKKTNTELILSSEDMKQRRRNVSSPLLEEIELSVDKIEVPTLTNELNLYHNKRNIVDIDSNVQQWENLQKTVQDLRTKTEKNKKRKMKTVDLEVMKRQLIEVEQTLGHMSEINDPMKLIHEENPLSLDTKALSERESEKTRSLHSEIQTMQNMFAKLENGNKTRGKVQCSRRTNIVVKSFFRIWRRGERTSKKRKGIFRCCRSSSNSFVEGTR